MNRGPRWSHVIIVLGVIAALAIASPVFGVSVSIKKAIRKEVAKQVGKAQGPAGTNGTNGATNVVVRQGPSVLVPNGGANDSLASCVGSERAVGGGASWDETVVVGMSIGDSAAQLSGSGVPIGWQIAATNTAAGGVNKHVRAKVVCASP